jgi:ubiquinone/menaquinone biosynthesis C-methylase UbiE
VLEIGFGPGHAIQLLCAQTAAGTVTGIDPSAEMVDQAAARNQDAIDAQRARLLLGDVTRLPFADASFDRVVAVSNFHIWPSRAEGLREVLRVLRPDGRLVIAVRRSRESPWPWSSPGVSVAQLSRDQALMEKVGFGQVQLATRKQGRRNVCLVADK